MSAALAGSVVVPLGGAVLALVGGRRAAPWVAAVTAAVSLALAGALALQVWRGGVVELEAGGWSVPLGIAMRADGLAAAMLVLTAVVGAAVGTAAMSEFAGERGRWARGDGFWPLWLLLWAAVAALVVSRDVFNVYVALELAGLSAVGLVAMGGGRAALEGALGYLLAAWLGATAYLLGVALIYAETGTLDMVAMSGRVGDGPAATAALALMSVGLLLKAAVVPLHFWLPRAHASAPAPVSAALSALVVTAAMVVLVRLWSEAMAGAVGAAAANLVGALGVVAIVWGSLLAMRQRSLKMLIAYSTVGQMGYLLLLIPLAAAPLARGGAGDRATEDAWVGGTYYAVTHGVAKGAMFLAAGCLIAAAGGDRIAALGGMAGRAP
ncbi:MAG: proton-conducting transporter membrane subunit, partial [Miltoncostaeaceae bacterium]